MGSHCSFEHLKHKLWPKEGPGVKFDSRPQKSGIDPIYLFAEGMQHIVEKLSTRVTTLLQTTSRSKVFSQSYGVPKSRESPLTQFRDSHSRVSGKKSYLDVGSMASHRIYYEGEGDGFPQVRVVVSLMCPCCPWLVLALRVFQLCTNHLVWVMCRLMWVGEACQLFLVPSRSSNMPFYPLKCCELWNVPRLLLFLLFSTWTHIWVLWRVGNASCMYLVV
jgi:hypothetical protein